MAPLIDLAPAIGGAVAALARVGWESLQFTRLPPATLLVMGLLAVPLVVLLVRGLGVKTARRVRVALPAVPSNIRRSPLSPLRQAPLVLFAAGVPLFAIALADPHAVSVRGDVTYSGRQIAMLLDSSGSMVMPFDAPQLKPVQERAFYVVINAAEYFLRLRKDGGKQDRLAIVQFGNEAFVVTPFTTDYDNAILSLRLIGEPMAWHRFNVFGTTIIQGLDQGLRLFETFDLVGASDNMILLITDGNDNERMFRGRSLDQMIAGAREDRIPIYMVRVGFGKPLGQIEHDGLWKPMVERSGGRFFAAYDEQSMLNALREIDRVATGRVVGRRAATSEPAFAGFALMAGALWLAAGAMKLTLPWFRTFP